jgi:trimethylamine monooxygenase
MYRELVVNGPKETLEYPDYSFEDCFVKTEKKWWPDVGDAWKPTYCSREIMFIYLKQRVLHHNMYKNIQFKTSVKNVVKKDGKFEVTTLTLEDHKLSSRTFDNVIVATGHYSTPNIPTFPGVEKLRKISVKHSHDFKMPTGYAGKNVFVLGGSYSAEDLASMVWKFGAKHVYVSSRSPFNPYNGWPENITFHAGLKECVVEHVPDTHGDTREKLVLNDGTELTDIDAMLLCTGYQYNFRFVDDSIRLKTAHWLFAENLYKGTFLTTDPGIMYLGMQDQILSFTLFDVQAWAARDYILGKLQLPDKAGMDADVKKWIDALMPINDFQNKFMECTQL